MTEIRCATTVQASQAATFDTFCDFARAAEMIPAIQRIEMLTPGPVGVGTRFRETRRMYGKEATEQMTVTVFDRPRHLELAADSHGTDYRARYAFKPEGSSTRVEMVFAATPRTMMARIMNVVMGPMIRSSMQKMMQADMDGAKAYIERQKGGG